MRRSAHEVINNLETRIARLEKSSARALDDFREMGRKIEQRRDIAFEHISEIEELIDAVKGDSSPASALTQVLQMTKHISKEEWLQVYKELKLGRGDYRRYERGMEEEAIKALMREQGYRTASSPLDPRFNPRLASFLKKNRRFFEEVRTSIYEREGYVTIFFNDDMPFKALEEIKDIIIRASYTTQNRASWQVEAWNK